MRSKFVFGAAVALSAFLAQPAAAASLSKRTVEKVVLAMEGVAASHSSTLLSDPAAVHSSKPLESAVIQAGFNPGEWEKVYGRVLKAYTALKENPDILTGSGGSKRRSGGGLLGRVLSAERIARGGSAAIFGGSAGHVGAEVAVDAASAAAGDDNVAGQAIGSVGSAAIYGGTEAAKDAAGQMAVDGAAQAIVGRIGGDAQAASGEKAPAKSDVGRADVKAVQPFMSRIGRALGR